MLVKNGKIKFIISFFLCCLVVVEGVYLILPRTKFSESIVKFVQNDFHKKTGGYFVADNLKIRTYPNFTYTIRSDEIAINDENEKNLFSSKNVIAKGNFFPLLFKTIDASFIKADKTKVNAIWRKDKLLGLGSTIHFEDYIIKLGLKFDFNDLAISLKDPQIVVFDEITSKKLKYEAPLLEHKVKNNIARLDTEAVFYVNDNLSNIKIHSNYPFPLNNFLENPATIGESTVENFDLSVLKSFFPNEYLGEAQDIQGFLSINAKKEENSDFSVLNFDLSDFVLLTKNSEGTITLPGHTRFTLTFKKVNDNFIINDAIFSGEKFKIIANGSIENSKSKDFKLDIDIPNASIEPLLNILPTNIKVGTNEMLVKKAKEYQLKGGVRGKLSLSGNEKAADAVGNIKITNANFRNVASVANINLDFKDQKVFVNAQGLMPDKKKIYVAGYSKMIDDEYGEYKITTDQNVNIASGFDILYPIADMFKINISILPYMRVNGIGDLDLQTKGTLDEYTTDGRFNFKNTAIALTGIDGLVTNANGTLDFNGKEFVFKTNSAKLDGSNCSITGIATADGKMDFTIKANNTNTGYLLSMANNSEWLKPYMQSVSMIEKADGKSNLDLTFKGKMKHFDPEKISETIKYELVLALINNSLKIKDLPIELSKINGKILAKDNNIKFDFKSGDSNSIVEYNGDVKDDIISLNAASKGVYMGDFSQMLPKEVKSLLSNEKIDFNMKYKSKIVKDKINFDDVTLKAKIIPNSFKDNKPLKIRNGLITMNRGNLSLKDFYLTLGKGLVHLNGSIAHFMKQNQSANLTGSLKNFDLAFLNSIDDAFPLDKNLKQVINFYTDYKGTINGDFKLVNNKLNGRLLFNDIEFLDKKNNLPVKIDNSTAFIKNNTVNIKNLNGTIADSPFFATLTITDSIKHPNIKGYVTSKINGNFIDNVINPHMTYPVRQKGESTFSVGFENKNGRLVLHPVLKLLPETELSFMGASLDPVDAMREINADIVINNNFYDIRSFKLLKHSPHEDSARRPSLLLNANAQITQNGETFNLLNANVKTFATVNAKLFNILFKKSIIKNGNFTCDLKYVIRNKKPILNGKMNITDLDMPIYNSSIQKTDIDINQNNVHIVSNGKVFESELEARILTKDIFHLPVVIEHFDIFAKKFNTNKILDTFSQVTFSNTPQLLANTPKDPEITFPLESIIIKKGKILADNVQYRMLNAKNLSAQFTLVKDHLLLIKDINVEIANGMLKSNGYYNFQNGEIAIIGEAKNVDANDITQAILDLKNQVYGTLSGQMSLITRGTTDEERLQNTYGALEFSIDNGKMPKLGSLEYLLKAGNLIKSGFSGLSINHIVNLFAPFETGEFEKINGKIQLENGEAKNIDIFSKGNNLSLYINGKYDLPNHNADMQVWGKLTNDRNNILGPIGNASIHTFFKLIPDNNKQNKDETIDEIKKIPNLNSKSKEIRLFNAKIDGDIESDNFVSTFYWID